MPLSDPNQAELFPDGALKAQRQQRLKERTKARKLEDKIARRVMRDLQAMRDANMLLLGDSALKNVWEEICVQQQVEESGYWDAYEATIQATIEGILAAHREVQLSKLWRLTAAADEWELVHPCDPCPPYDKSDVIELIQTNVLGKAADFSNSRVQKYCERIWETD